MVKVIISHPVKDYAIWRFHFDADEVRRQKAGIKNERVYQDSTNSNLVYVFWEMEDPTILDILFNDPDLVETMENAGVLAKPVVRVIQEI